MGHMEDMTTVRDLDDKITALLILCAVILGVVFADTLIEWIARFVVTFLATLILGGL